MYFSGRVFGKQVGQLKQKVNIYLMVILKNKLIDTRVEGRVQEKIKRALKKRMI